MQQDYVLSIGYLISGLSHHIPGASLMLIEFVVLILLSVKMDSDPVAHLSPAWNVKLGVWKWKLRSVGSLFDVFPGLVYALLLPIAVILSSFYMEKSDVYKSLIQTFSLSQALTSVLVMVQLFRTIDWQSKAQGTSTEKSSCDITIPVVSVAQVFPIVAVYIAIHSYVYSLGWWAVCIETVCLALLCVVQSMLPVWMPSSFSMGETAICGQGITLFVAYAVCLIGDQFQVFWPRSPYLATTETSTLFVLIAVISCGMVIVLAYLCSAGALGFYFLLLIVAGGFALPASYLLLDQNFVAWTFNFVMFYHSRVLLFIYWALCSVASVGIVLFNTPALASQSQASGAYSQSVQRQCQGKERGSYEVTTDHNRHHSVVSTRIRKQFHILALFMFIPGLVIDRDMLSVAASCGLVVFLMLECLRVLRVPPAGDLLQQYFCPLLDKQDEGPVILTHIYLLVGCSLPLWLYPRPEGPHLALYAGVLSLGVGDTSAAVFGSLYGRHRWPGTKKTLEGTMAAVFSQLLAVTALFYLGGCPPVHWLKTLVAVLLTSLLEAYTTEIDNLVLPVFMYCLLL